MPRYDFTRPDSVARFLLTLPTRARRGEKSIRVRWYERFEREKSAAFMDRVREVIERERA